MDFTYKSYESLIELLYANSYNICSYHDHANYKKCALMRHDVDFSLEKALEFAKFEGSLQISSTYFVLLSSDFYNIFSCSNMRIIDQIKELGHQIGLHFDEKKYIGTPTGNKRKVSALIEDEIKIMSAILDFEITAVSMHRPSQETLAANYTLSKAINSYSKTFFEEFKYLSDSRHHWREPILDIVGSNKYNKLHILTHPFWYSDNNISASDMCKQFVNKANYLRYLHMYENMRDFDEFMQEDEVI